MPIIYAMNMFKVLSITISFFFLYQVVHSQENKKFIVPQTHNWVLRYNITPRVLYGSGNFEFGVERRIADYQTVSLNIGSRKFPSIINLPSNDLGIGNETNNSGFSLAADYRRYMKSENRHFAPRGVYWGPYVAYYQFNFANELSIPDSLIIAGSKAELDASLQVVNFGIELGYQFLIKDRLTVDLTFIGPGYGFYRGELDLVGDAELDPDNEYLQDVAEVLINRFPAVEEFFDEKSYSVDSGFRTWTVGMRYVIQIGYHF